MFQTSSVTKVEDRTVGVVARDVGTDEGANLFSVGKETYLIDEDGRVIHEWRNKRVNFTAYLLPNGNLLRDGNDTVLSPLFHAGGAAGFVEEVTWDNELVWHWEAQPRDEFLTHHDLQPLPNGNVLVLLWRRVLKQEAMAAGRRAELLPDGEMWDNLVYELKPNGKGGADVVWKWSVFDHLVQDADPSAANYVEDLSLHPNRMDINYCPVGGKAACRNQELLKSPAAAGSGKTGEKDWAHVNCVSYCPERDVVVMSMNIFSEIWVVDHSTTTEEAASNRGGRHGRGGDLLWRYGNPMVYRRGTRMDRVLFCQHAAQVLDNGNIICFNNGRRPDRHWSSVDEIKPKMVDGKFAQPEPGKTFEGELVWSYGPSNGKAGSFYCTHISSCQRLPNGNTLVVMGPQGIAFEVTPGKQEVWRYISPVAQIEPTSDAPLVAFVRQGEQRTAGKFSLFYFRRYPLAYTGIKGNDQTSTKRHLEA